MSKKKIRYLCEGGIEIYDPQDHHLTSLIKPRDGKQ